MKKNLFGSKTISTLLHVVAWIILLAIPIYFIKRWQVGNDFLWFYYTNTIISGIVFYTNYLFLVPRFFFTSKKYRYYLSVFVLIIGTYFVSDISNDLIFKHIPGKANTEEFSRPPAQEHKPGPPPEARLFGRPPFGQIHTFNSLFLIFFSIGLRVLERNSRIEKLQKEMEKEKLNSELAFLKNQISPHFFFNTLNNIYSLISINPEDSQKAVLKLSKLMRYLLYESEQGNTKLTSEIEFMNNYIDLMKLRVNDKINLSVSFPDKFEDINIPPLLFIPFIENAFKHGISYREKSFIIISMTTIKDSVSFRCSNSLVKSGEDADSVHSGIGLENVSKRLNLLFPGSHELKINKSDKEFEVLLQISFS